MLNFIENILCHFETIHGHMFGGLGILAGSACNWACIPPGIRLHDGLQAAREWKGASVSAASHVVQMVEDAYHAARTFGDSLLLLDRYFLTVPALEKPASYFMQTHQSEEHTHKYTKTSKTYKVSRQFPCFFARWCRAVLYACTLHALMYRKNCENSKIYQPKHSILWYNVDSEGN